MSKILAKEIFSQKTEENKFKVLLEGDLNLTSAGVKQQNSYQKNLLPDNSTKNYLNDNYNFVGDSEVNLRFEVESKNKTKTSLNANFQGNADINKRKRNPYLDQIFIAQKNRLGRFEIGNTKPANQQMKYDPASFARGAGGVRGKYLEHVNLPILADFNNSALGVCQNNIGDPSCANVKVPSFIMLSQSPIGHGGYAKSSNAKFSDNNISGTDLNNNFSKNNLRSINDDSFEGAEDATKISYFSPDLAGFKFGLSYTPNSQDNGITKNVAAWQNNAEIHDVFSVGLNYVHYLDNGALIAFSSTAEKGNSVTNNRADLLAYDFAINLNYFGFDVGFSYGIWQDYGQSKSGIYSCPYNSSLNLNDQNCSINTSKFNNPYYFSSGIAYKFGPVGASITSLNSNFQNNKFSSLSFGLDYKLKKYLMPYFEVTKFTFKSAQPKASSIYNQNYISSDLRQVRDNDGLIFLTGISYSF